MRRKRHQQPPEGKPEPKRKKQRTPTRKPASLGPITEDSIGNLSRDDLRISRLGRGESRKVSERRGLIAKRLNVGTPHSSIIDEVTRTFNISPKLAQEEVHVVCRERAELSEAERTTFKSEQIIRLQQDLAEMRAEADKPYRCIAAHETLLAKITGTIEAPRVDINIEFEQTNALMAMVSKLDSNAIESMVAEARAAEAIISTGVAVDGSG